MKLLDGLHRDEKQHNKGYSLSLIKADARLELIQLNTANSPVVF